MLNEKIIILAANNQDYIDYLRSANLDPKYFIGITPGRSIRGYRPKEFLYTELYKRSLMNYSVQAMERAIETEEILYQNLAHVNGKEIKILKETDRCLHCNQEFTTEYPDGFPALYYKAWRKNFDKKMKHVCNLIKNNSCGICKKLLNTKDPLSRDCGGDCLECMNREELNLKAEMQEAEAKSEI